MPQDLERARKQRPWSTLTEDEGQHRLREIWPYDDEPPDELAFYEIAHERGMLNRQRRSNRKA